MLVLRLPLVLVWSFALVLRQQYRNLCPVSLADLPIFHSSFSRTPMIIFSEFLFSLLLLRENKDFDGFFGSFTLKANEPI